MTQPAALSLTHTRVTYLETRSLGYVLRLPPLQGAKQQRDGRAHLGRKHQAQRAHSFVEQQARRQHLCEHDSSRELHCKRDEKRAVESAQMTSAEA